MKKLIFRNLAKDTLNFFLIMCFTVGIIVWTLQAGVLLCKSRWSWSKNLFHICLFNFPKIIHRIIPFIFLYHFYILNEYEKRNRQIFWTFWISKMSFAINLFISVIIAIFQMCLDFYLYSQLKGREF